MLCDIFCRGFAELLRLAEKKKRQRENCAIHWTGNYSLGYSYLSILSLNIFSSRLFSPVHFRIEKKKIRLIVHFIAVGRKYERNYIIVSLQMVPRLIFFHVYPSISFHFIPFWWICKIILVLGTLNICKIYISIYMCSS